MDENNVVPKKLKATLLLNYSNANVNTQPIEMEKNALSNFGTKCKM